MGCLILIGVNLLTFVLFFAVNTPDDMARLSIGGQRVSQQAIEKWKIERGYDKPLFFNRRPPARTNGPIPFSLTVRCRCCASISAFPTAGRDIGHEIGHAHGAQPGAGHAHLLPGPVRLRGVRAAAGVLSAAPRWISGAWCCACPAVDLRLVLHHCRAMVFCQGMALVPYSGYVGRLGQPGASW